MICVSPDVLDVCEWGTLETAVRLDNPRILLLCQNTHELIRELLSDLPILGIRCNVIQVVRIYPQVVKFLRRKLSESYLE